MKKVYIKPLTESLTDCTVMDILAGSMFEVKVENDDFNEEIMTSLSRNSNNIWDDDEEE
ncbi:MAG: hypothetical protein K5928_01050 [Prevotella sp.]|nr:hypothetical protein [Prevotella sp.]